MGQGWPWHATLAALVALSIAGSTGCGGSPTEPDDGAQGKSLAVITTTCAPIGSGSSREYSTVYFIWGLSNLVSDGSARPLEAVLRVGEEARLSLDFEGCGYGINEAWTSTSSAVASLTVDPSFNGGVAHLAALAPGVTEVFVDFEGPDGERHRTYPAYCPGSRYLCVEPRTPFSRVRVVAP
jgi:hypothetical protein